MTSSSGDFALEDQVGDHGVLSMTSTQDRHVLLARHESCDTSLEFSDKSISVRATLLGKKFDQRAALVGAVGMRVACTGAGFGELAACSIVCGPDFAIRIVGAGARCSSRPCQQSV